MVLRQGQSDGTIKVCVCMVQAKSSPSSTSLSSSSNSRVSILRIGMVLMFKLQGKNPYLRMSLSLNKDHLLHCIYIYLLTK